jgi:hypothetical protein
MSLDDMGQLDFLSVSADGSEVELTIADHLEWTVASTDDHLQKLQAKIYAYLDFISSGELFRRYAKAAGRSLTIRIRCKHRMPQAGLTFLSQIRALVESEGVGLEFTPPRDD